MSADAEGTVAMQEGPGNNKEHAAAGRQERAAKLAREPQVARELDPLAQLRAAAISGDVARAQLRLSPSAAQAPDTYGDNVLHLAARSGHASILALTSDVDVNQRSKAGATPLWLACFHGHKEVAQLLLERGAQPERQHGMIGSAPLGAAAAQGHLPLVQLLVFDHGAKIDMPNKNGRTALWSAAYEGHGAVVRFLVERGAATGRKSKNGHTPFSAAFQTRDTPAQEHEYENSPRPHSPAYRGRYDEVIELLTDVTRAEDQNPVIEQRKVFKGCVEIGVAK